MKTMKTMTMMALLAVVALAGGCVAVTPSDSATFPPDGPGGVLLAARNAGEEPVLTIPGPGKIELRMKRIPAGSVDMGSSAGQEDRIDDEGPMHRVMIGKPFYLGVFEVTQAQWGAVMGACPAKRGGEPLFPVENVSWDDCQAFIAKLNAMGIGTFRLPTEAEWEYACRAGTQTAYSFGRRTADLDEYAWYDGNSGSSPHQVGTKEPNPWGLYDMHGNVWEWCGDWYGPYGKDGQTDPAGATAGTYRVYRGGSWGRPSGCCRSAHRSGCSPSYRLGDLGFRLVMETP